MNRTCATLVVMLWVVDAGQMAHAQETALARGAKHVQNRDYKLAAEAFEEGVAAGDAACMDYLGWLYLEGLGKRPSTWIAYGYFREAARLGNDQACRNLGNMYFYGRGVDADPAQAAAWWEKSVKLGGDPRPSFSLGQLHYLGDGVPRNIELARKHWQHARKLGSDDAVVALAVLEANDSGEFNGEDLKVLADKGHVTAQGTLKFFALAKSNPKAMVKDAPFIHQAHNFCALASSTMLLRHQGAKASQFDVARSRSKHEWGQGSHWDEMVAVAGKLGQKWKINSFPNTGAGYDAAKAALLAHLHAGRPAVIDILEGNTFASAHSILICGHDPMTGEFIARNPALNFPGYQVIPEDRLKVIWRSRGFIPNNTKLLRPIMAPIAAER
jgi:TPR repeat protein